jgi:hypothetical protein
MKEDGYIHIDSRFSPGVSDEFIRAAGLDPAKVPHAAEGKVFESGTLSCSHCQKHVAISATRTRARGHCKACNHYICDACNADLFLTGQCQSMRKRLDLAREEAALLEQRYGQSFNGTQILTSVR